MSSRVLSTALLLLASLPCFAGPKPCDLPQQPQVDCELPAHPVLVGEIVIVGNSAVPNDLILSRLPFTTGQLLSAPTLKMAEDNLSRMDLFLCDPDGSGIRPTVKVLDPDGPAVVKDILVEVHERCGAVQSEVADILVDVEEMKTGGLLFGLGVNSDAGVSSATSCCADEPACTSSCAPRGVCGGPTVACGSKCDGDKPACACEKDCSCCGCKKVQKDEDIETVEDCNCGEGCKCCGCKKTVAANCAEGCCPMAGNCCVGSAVGFFLLEQCCPTLKVCAVCPVVQVQVRQAMQPCAKKFFATCKQMFKQTATGCADCSDCSGCCAEKAAKSTCGQCQKQVRVEIKVCPWAGCAKQAVGFVWKNGKKFEQLTVMPKEEAASKAAAECPYLKQQVNDRIEKKQPRQVGMACTPLDNLVKMEKARRIMSLADLLYESGKYDLAIKRYRKVTELVPGSQWDVQAQDSIVMAQAMKGVDEWYAQFGQQVLDAHLEEMQKSATEEAEPIQVKPLPCKPQTECQALQEFKEKFCDMLDQARCAVEAGDIDIAKKLVLEASQLQRPEVAALLDAAQQCLVAGCHEEAWDKVNHVLMLEPNCLAAQDLQRQLIDIAAGQCDQCPYSSGCEQEEPPCSDEGCEPSCPGIGFRHQLPGVDPSIVEVMERVLIECARPDRYDYEGDCEEQSLEIDDEACELELYEDVEFDRPIDPTQLGKLLHQIDVAVRDFAGADGKSCCKGAAPIKISVQFGRFNCQMVMDKNGAGCICIDVKPGDAQGFHAWQEAHQELMKKWLQAMIGGSANEGDTEESEEPLYQLETDLDPDW